ncbi:MAG: hypothetical protein RXQ99_10025 [Acidianus sp.]
MATEFIEVVANGLSTLSDPLGILIEIIGVVWTYVLVCIVILIFSFLDICLRNLIIFKIR